MACIKHTAQSTTAISTPDADTTTTTGYFSHKQLKSDADIDAIFPYQPTILLELAVNMDREITTSLLEIAANSKQTGELCGPLGGRRHKRRK
ncbi:Hypothetical predicted protein [Octopus vulgaris]|uniref:Uncharacterized protein n=1 Tax=Octopus vulgaris TaxID=6645 RepID=A0AA36FI93_OCTVU|nr:Hypothetical predicted protein [Octopus vulgaris]